MFVGVRSLHCHHRLRCSILNIMLLAKTIGDFLGIYVSAIHSVPICLDLHLN